MTKGILALWMDIEPLAEEECTEWYVREHIADRIAVPAYFRARRFKALSGLGYLAIYDAELVEGLCDPGYMALLDNITDWGLRMRGAFSNTARETFSASAAICHGEGSVVATLRFRCEPNKSKHLATWITETCLPSLAKTRGIVSAEYWTVAPEIRGRMDQRRITGKADAHVERVLLVEGVARESIAAATADLITATSLPANGAIDIQIDCYTYQFGISKLSGQR